MYSGRDRRTILSCDPKVPPKFLPSPPASDPSRDGEEIRSGSVSPPPVRLTFLTQGLVFPANRSTASLTTR